MAPTSKKKLEIKKSICTNYLNKNVRCDKLKMMNSLINKARISNSGAVVLAGIEACDGLVQKRKSEPLVTSI